jgi:iron(III) transport system substrate-binding protein
MYQRFMFIALAVFGSVAMAQTVPPGYPGRLRANHRSGQQGGQGRHLQRARHQGRATADQGFHGALPRIKVEYSDLNSTELYNRFIAEAASGQGSADVMWSSAMDLQVKLVDEGHALGYLSPEAAKLPPWAVYKSQAYGTTYEPAVFVYNKRW